ncbi:MAG: hypothetical protein MHM6MM_005926 [Cercozoa sp. M6MM]
MPPVPIQVLRDVNLEEARVATLSQGAEGRVFVVRLPHEQVTECVVKQRFAKTWRHPQLDAMLTRQRLNAEARMLERCHKHGIRAPQLYWKDASRNLLFVEHIHGRTVKEALREQITEDGVYPEESVRLAEQMGGLVAELHLRELVHGDLTTSNFVVSSSESGAPVVTMIDFGLSSANANVEDKAVDLYVLERAFSSTHTNSEELITALQRVYTDRIGNKRDEIFKRLEKVRARGRKRTMIG